LDSEADDGDMADLESGDKFLETDGEEVDTDDDDPESSSNDESLDDSESKRDEG
jgi:hypothetical protein